MEGKRKISCLNGFEKVNLKQYKHHPIRSKRKLINDVLSVINRNRGLFKSHDLKECVQVCDLLESELYQVLKIKRERWN